MLKCSFSCSCSLLKLTFTIVLGLKRHTLCQNDIIYVFVFLGCSSRVLHTYCTIIIIKNILVCGARDRERLVEEEPGFSNLGEAPTDSSIKHSEP